MNILITGGAGYIGSVLAKELVKFKHHIFIVDTKETLEEYPSKEYPNIDICRYDITNLDHVLFAYKIDLVIHLAATSIVDAQPQQCFQNNISSGIALLNTMIKHNVKKLIFASSCSVYKPSRLPLTEDSELDPLSAYGESKLVFERLLKWYSNSCGLKYLIFRYFNVAGAVDKIGDTANTRLIPNLCRSAITDKPLEIYGTDYPTRDGTPLRDYVHVLDVVNAHILAIDKLDKLSGNTYNLGSSQNYTVKDVVNIARECLNKPIPIISCDRRSGDSSYAVADIKLAQKELGWCPQYGLETIIQSQFNWMTK
jgi:UDP-glucose 4-epimerase